MLEIVPGQLGPQLVASGAIDPSRFAEACASVGEPLDETRLQILQIGSNRPIAFDASSQHFLLNLFWALGLVNANSILTRGPMLRHGMGRISRFASTGGWTLGARPVIEVYARTPLVTLTAKQQQRLEEVTSNVFRPCCDNPASFPDCNHGMAMLGLLTRLSAEDRDIERLFVAAKTANRFWFPRETDELARYVKASRGIEYSQLGAQEAGGRALFSGGGFAKVTAWLGERGMRGPAGSARCVS